MNLALNISEKNIKIALAAIATFFFFSFFSNSFAQNEILVDENYIKRLDKEVALTSEKISKARDPKVKHQNVRKLLTLYNAYYHPSVRLELIRRKHPEYAKKLEKSMLLSDEEIQAEMQEELKRAVINSDYIDVSKISALSDMAGLNRKPICEEAANTCLKEIAPLNCNYVLDKCKGVVSDEIYEKLFDKYGRDDLSR